MESDEIIEDDLYLLILFYKSIPFLVSVVLSKIMAVYVAVAAYTSPMGRLARMPLEIFLGIMNIIGMTQYLQSIINKVGMDGFINLVLMIAYTLLFYPLVWCLFRKFKGPLNYRSCPYPDCNKSVKIYENWQCNKCNKFQEKDRYVTDKCRHCGRRLDAIFCEHCHREYKIK